jgi:hypothetical protein
MNEDGMSLKSSNSVRKKRLEEYLNILDIYYLY